MNLMTGNKGRSVIKTNIDQLGVWLLRLTTITLLGGKNGYCTSMYFKVYKGDVWCGWKNGVEITRALDISRLEIGEGTVTRYHHWRPFTKIDYVIFLIHAYTHGTVEFLFLGDQHYYIAMQITTDARFQKFLIWIKHKGISLLPMPIAYLWEMGFYAVLYALFLPQLLISMQLFHGISSYIPKVSK